jgi:Leucine-rich repeat (LRR) protein
MLFKGVPNIKTFRICYCFKDMCVNNLPYIWLSNLWEKKNYKNLSLGTNNLNEICKVYSMASKIMTSNIQVVWLLAYFVENFK